MVNEQGDNTVRTPHDPPPWQPASHAIWRRYVIDPAEAAATTLLLQHPGNPFLLNLASDLDFDKALQKVALAYLHHDAIKPLLLFPPNWLRSLEPDANMDALGWMPVEWPLNADQGCHEPFGSLRVGDPAHDHQVALFATERLANGFRGSGFGLRIVLRLRPVDGRVEARIDGLTASLPFGDYLNPQRQWTPSERMILADSLRSDALRELLSLSTGLTDIRIRGVRLADQAEDDKLPTRIELRGIGQLPDLDPDPHTVTVPYAFTAIARYEAPNTLVEILLHRSALMAAAKGDARVFRRDAASCGAADLLRDRRPTRDEDKLNTHRLGERVNTVQKGPLTSVVGGGLVVVSNCPRFVDGDVTAGMPKEVDLPGSGPQVRSNDASAVQSYVHVKDLLKRLDSYGLPASQYFRLVRPELNVFYRSGISPGPGKDGRTVNASVQPEGWKRGAIGPDIPLGDRPAVELRLALANLSRRQREARDPASDKKSEAIPLGIGADPRWMWHEFGHILLLASTGELELRFAHSVGDALAAIVADPQSALAKDAKAPRYRYATFPFVQLSRRHDRCVQHGWSWNGAIRAALARVPDTEQPRRKGYVSEQLLSTSLFRLYRCLGGDTAINGNYGQPLPAERQRASHYASYLVMLALHLLGDARVVPASTPEQLAFALILADIGTGGWAVKDTAHARSGGCAHKAIRWAFEAQGMYRDAPDTSGNALGQPPAVDVYIDSRRPDSDLAAGSQVDLGRGSYLPVSLHWQDDAGNKPVPLWQAGANAIVRGNDGKISVNVGNRGQQTADAVEVHVWWARWPAPAGQSLDWAGNTQWTPCTAAAGPATPIETGASMPFGPFDLPGAPTQGYVVLAEATCPQDRANNDSDTGLYCSLHPTPIVDLVANDNNLGLLVVP